MPQWEGIEDATTVPAPVWFARQSDKDEWKPLRKTDCKALNKNPESLVLIECGRATADPVNSVIRYNFTNQATLQLRQAIWFVREEKSSKEVVLEPLPIVDSAKVEMLYQSAVTAGSSLGDGIDAVLKAQVALSKTAQDEKDHVVMIVKNSNGMLSMRKKPTNQLANLFGGTNLPLQRGYGNYTIDGEEEEVMLGPVRHLIFMVHGIGEAMWSRGNVAGMESHQAMVNRLRLAIAKQQVTDWKKACEKAEKQKQPLPPVPNRIEFLPIEWYDRVHSSSTELMSSLRATTLPTIPALRAISNDVVFDVLMYMTPDFSEATIDTVTTQISDVYEGFKNVHPDFIPSGGKTSIIGHSLGSVIVWDLLSLLKDSQEREKGTGSKDDPIQLGVAIDQKTTKALGYHAYAQTDDANRAKNGTWGPSLPKPMTKTIPFVPHFTCFLGSPLGMFLTLRGAHAVFDEMRLTSAITSEADYSGAPPTVSPFSLPTGAVYNVFHPSDPVAYRIEPLLLPQDMDRKHFPPPIYIVKEGEQVRLHVKAMQVSDGIKRALASTTSDFSSIFTQVAESTAAALAAVDSQEGTKAKSDAEASKKRSSTGADSSSTFKFALGGRSDRVDYQMQPGVVDNEYLSAVSAHSSYFTHRDIFNFITDVANR